MLSAQLAAMLFGSMGIKPYIPTNHLRQATTRPTVLVGQFLMESWCRVPWGGPPALTPKTDPDCPCLLGTSPRYFLVDRFGQKHSIVLNADMARSVGGVNGLLSKWVTVTGHPWANDATATEMERLDVVTQAAAQRNDNPILQTWLPTNAFPKHAVSADVAAAPRTGTELRKYVSVLVRFADSKGVTPNPASWYSELMRSTWPGMDHFTREASYNKVGITNQTVDWLNLPQPMSFYLGTYGLDTTKIMADALPLIGTKVDWSSVWGVNIWSNSDDHSQVDYASYYQLTAQGQNRYIPITKEIPGSTQSALGHEDGHNYGNDHSSGAYNSPYDSHWDVNSSGSARQPNVTGLGGIAVGVHYNAYHKAKRGWIDPARIFYALPGTSKQIRIERLAQPTNSTDYLMAKVYIGGYDTRYYTVEARKFAGYDSTGGIPGEAVVIHNCDELRMVTDTNGGPRMDRASQVVDHHHNGDPNLDGMWLPGQTYTDPANGINITVNSADTTGFKVTIVVDPKQPMPGVVNNSGDVGGGSLREAFYFHSEFPSKSIPFQLPITDPAYANGCFTIHLKSPLPSITNAATTIDATQEANFLGISSTRPLIMLDGTNAGSYASGLDVEAPNCTIKGLSIGNFAGNGIYIAGAKTTNTIIQNCYIGVSPSGAIAPNQWDGISIWGGANHVLIGKAGAGNVLSGNLGNGISINGPGEDSNTIQGNTLGSDPSGKVAMPNGMGIQLTTSSTNNIGGSSAGQGNLISGNKYDAVYIAGPTSTGNKIVGNTIGADVTGEKAIPNGGTGIDLVKSVANSVIQANLVSGNGGDGIAIGDPGSSANQIIGNTVGLSKSGLPLGNKYSGLYVYHGAATNTIGGTSSSTRNVVSANQCGIYVSDSGTTGNQILGNYVGVDGSGLKAVGNGTGIVIVNGAQNTTVGGATSGQGNLVSANTYTGIFVQTGPCLGTQIIGNVVGLDSTGNGKLGNGQQGIGLYKGITSCVVRGNWVSANGGEGIELADTGTYQNLISGNMVGITKNGGDAGNRYDGILIHGGANGNIIGGIWSADRNVLSANQNGMSMGDAGTVKNVVLGNYMGTDATGTKALPNKYNGLFLYNGASNNTIGGSISGTGNLISGNLANGITIDGTNGSTANLIYGNQIGISSAGKPLGNAEDGIAIYNGASHNVVGGSAAQGNVIANSQSGVSVWDSSVGNTIRANSIYGNSWRGIYLTGSGNHLQAAPTIKAVTESSGKATISVTLTGIANTSYVVDFYGVSNPAPGGLGQGDTYFGSMSVTTNASGLATVVADQLLGAGARAISATATNLNTGDTSMFSVDWSVVTISTVTASPITLKGGGTVTATVTLTSAAPAGGATIILPSLPSVLVGPASILIPAGATKATFTIATKPVTATTITGFTCAYAGSARPITLTLTP